MSYLVKSNYPVAIPSPTIKALTDDELNRLTQAFEKWLQEAKGKQ